MPVFDVHSPPRIPYRFTSAAWKSAGLVFLLFLAVTVVGPFVSPTEDEAPATAMGGDFLVAYSAGTLAREGNFQSLHDPHAFMERIRAIGDSAGLPPGGGTVGPWLNPPFYLLPFIGLSMLPYRIALACWWLGSAAAIVGAALLLCRMLREPPPGRRLKLSTISSLVDWRLWGLIPILTLLSMSALQTFTHGQSSAFSLLILTAAVYFWRGGHGLCSGMALGLLFFKPQLALLIAAFMVLDLGRRAVLGMMLTGALLAWATFFVIPDEVLLYLQHSMGAASGMQMQGVFPWHRHATFLSFFRLLFQSSESAPASMGVLIAATVCSIIFVAVLVIGFFKQRKPRLLPARGDVAAAARRRDRVICAAIVLTPLVMPYFMDYDLLLLAVPAVLFARELIHKPTLTKSDRWARRAWVALYLMLYLSPGFTATFGVSLNIPVLIVLSAIMIGRVVRPEAKRKVRADFSMGYSTRLRPAA